MKAEDIEPDIRVESFTDADVIAEFSGFMQGFYDGIIFHRVIEGFMAQTGDPTGTGTGGSDLPDVAAEFNKFPHLRGSLSMARAQMQPSVQRFNRGVRWERERMDLKGTRWVSMLLPVWLYAYHQPGPGGGLLHYIAVNGRTGETMGSVPVQQWKLVLAALSIGTVVEALALWFIAR